MSRGDNRPQSQLEDYRHSHSLNWHLLTVLNGTSKAATLFWHYSYVGARNEPKFCHDVILDRTDVVPQELFLPPHSSTTLQHHSEVKRFVYFYLIRTTFTDILTLRIAR